MAINSIMQEKNNVGNGVGMVVHKDLKQQIVGVKRLGDIIIAIKLVLEEDIMHTIRACAVMDPKQT